MSVLLNEEEIKEAVFGKEGYDLNIAKAQLKKVMEWGGGLCPHQGYPTTTLKERWWCGKCREDLLKEIDG